jgi:hypothetical protein
VHRAMYLEIWAIEVFFMCLHDNILYGSHVSETTTFFMAVMLAKQQFWCV